MQSTNSNILNHIIQAIPLFSKAWKTNYGLFLQHEHLERFVIHSRNGFQNGFHKYTLESEYHTELNTTSSHLTRLKDVYTQIENTTGRDPNTIQKQLQEGIETIPFSELLLLMGQRLSSTSLRTVEALPPLKKTLLQACFTPFNAHMSTVVRAWEKHAERTTDAFWPKRQGHAAYKEQLMEDFVKTFLNNWEWWNVYSHQKHGYVFELRTDSGHGMRWTKDGTQLIGFLEPFVEHKE